jgi:hypothetical protein
LRDVDAVAKIDCQLRDVEFPESGDYLFILEVNATPSVARRFKVVLSRSAP